MEEDLIILMAESGPLDPLLLGHDSFIESFWDLCVIATRTRFTLIIIASTGYMYANCQNWRTLIDHIRRQNDC